MTSQFPKSVRLQKPRAAVDSSGVFSIAKQEPECSPHAARRECAGHDIQEIIIRALIDRREAATENIRFVFRTFSLGPVMVAASGKGIAAILMGDDREALRRELKGAFPHARLAENETALKGAMAKVIALLEAPPKGLDLPLDLRGSALQQAVWQALRAVPCGKTVTYGQIAKALPLPATAQEVGAACAANVLAVAVPCHRVVKADGSISGYRWGVRRKRTLIEREAAA